MCLLLGLATISAVLLAACGAGDSVDQAKVESQAEAIEARGGGTAEDLSCPADMQPSTKPVCTFGKGGEATVTLDGDGKVTYVETDPFAGKD